MFVFNHIPKCGGTSFRNFLDSVFTVHLDYAPQGAARDPDVLQAHKDAAYDLKDMGQDDCIAGHFNLPGVFLNQRYPGVFETARVFSLMRDPFAAAASGVRYLTSQGVFEPASAQVQTERLLKRAGYFPRILGVQRVEDIEAVLDRYWFIAPLDRVDRAARLIETAAGRRGAPVPVLNATSGDEAAFSPDAEARFREEAALDYALYEAVRARFEARFGSHQRPGGFLNRLARRLGMPGSG